MLIVSCWSEILADWSDYELVEEIKNQIKRQKMPNNFTLSFGSHSETVKVTKKDKSTFSEIKNSIQIDTILIIWMTIMNIPTSHQD